MGNSALHRPLVNIDPQLSRAAVLQSFTDQVYGKVPPLAHELSWRLLKEHDQSASMKRQQWAIDVTTERGSQRVTAMVDLPINAVGCAAFLGLNFHGNHTCTSDPEVLRVGEGSRPATGGIHPDGLREPVRFPVPRGVHAHRWPSEIITGRGYAAVTLSYLQCGPDSIDIFSRGIHPLFSPRNIDTREQTEWGSIAVWAWMLSRVLDALEGGMVSQVDAGRVAVTGHSRLGKAALWAAAQDVRFAAVISNNSGCMGAALSRAVGETPELLARVRPQWFAPSFACVMNGGTLPVDQHQLLAALAPRPLYVASASGDLPADPEGEFASLVAASSAWENGGSAFPEAFPGSYDVLQPSNVPLGFHLRQGEHDVMPWDWQQWLTFADRWV